VRQSGRWGFVGSGGKIAINPQFDEVKSFTNGLAWIKTGGRFGYVDAGGKYIWSPSK